MAMVDKIKEKLLEMLVYFDTVCRDNHLTYYAIGGTFLGALRHKGFIPWDNDIDVAMPRSDYDRIVEIINGDNSKYFVETPESPAEDYLYSVTKLYDTSTTLVENLKVDCKRGLYLDIFPLDGIGNTLSEAKKNYRKISLMNALFACKTSVVRPQRAWWKNLAIHAVGEIAGSFIDTKKLLIRLDRLCRQYRYQDSEYVGVLLTQYGMRYVMPKYLFLESSRYVFENTTIIGVKDYDQYLTRLFGNWRELPSFDKRVEGHDYKYIDLVHSYLE